MTTAARLHVYAFGSTGPLAGEIVGAMERAEPEAGAGLLDALWVSRDPASGELQAIDLATGRADGTPIALLDFRLDPGSRARITRRTLADHRGGVPRPVVEDLGTELAPGAARLLVLVVDEMPEPLADAVARCGGRRVAAEDVRAATLGDVPSELLRGRA